MGARTDKPEGPMQFSYRVDRERGFAYVHGSGPMDLEESLAAPQNRFTLPGFDSSFRVVLGMREVEWKPTANDVMEVARHLIRIKSFFEHPTALIVEGSVSRTGAELVAAVAGVGGYKIRVFGDLEAAESWLISDDAGQREAL